EATYVAGCDAGTGSPSRRGNQGIESRAMQAAAEVGRYLVSLSTRPGEAHRPPTPSSWPAAGSPPRGHFLPAAQPVRRKTARGGPPADRARAVRWFRRPRAGHAAARTG